MLWACDGDAHVRIAGVRASRRSEGDATGTRHHTEQTCEGLRSLEGAKAKKIGGETGRRARSKGKIEWPVWEMKAGGEKWGFAWPSERQR